MLRANYVATVPLFRRSKKSTLVTQEQTNLIDSLLSMESFETVQDTMCVRDFETANGM